MCEKLSVAIIGLIGVIVGSVISVLGSITLHHLQEMATAKSDEPRKNLLRDMLRDSRFEWRSLETLSHIISADQETTKRCSFRLARGHPRMTKVSGSA